MYILETHAISLLAENVKHYKHRKCVTTVLLNSDLDLQTMSRKMPLYCSQNASSLPVYALLFLAPAGMVVTNRSFRDEDYIVLSVRVA